MQNHKSLAATGVKMKAAEILALSCEAVACEAELMLCPAPRVDVGLLKSSNSSLHINARSMCININALPIIILRGK